MSVYLCLRVHHLKVPNFCFLSFCMYICVYIMHFIPELIFFYIFNMIHIFDVSKLLFRYNCLYTLWTWSPLEPLLPCVMNPCKEFLRATECLLNGVSQDLIRELHTPSHTHTRIHVGTRTNTINILIGINVSAS